MGTQEAEKAMQMAAQQQAANVPVSQVPAPQVSTQIQQDAAMDVDGASHPQPQEPGSSLKRKAEEQPSSSGGHRGGQGQAGEGSKKVKIGEFLWFFMLGCHALLGVADMNIGSNR